jgi:peroxiredoxin-like protein
MTDVSFDIELAWWGAGREGIGAIQGDDLTFEFSGPESMGGRGSGSNPEELLVCAVSSCYAATLSAVLVRAELPVAWLSVSATGTVTGFPGHARMARIVVSPLVLGGDSSRDAEYEVAAGLAHDRCLIGHALASEVTYEVASVRVRPNVAIESDAGAPRAG